MPTTSCIVHNFIRMHSAQDCIFFDFERREYVDDGRGGVGPSSQVPIELHITPFHLF